MNICVVTHLGHKMFEPLPRRTDQLQLVLNVAQRRLGRERRRRRLGRGGRRLVEVASLVPLGQFLVRARVRDRAAVAQHHHRRHVARHELLGRTPSVWKLLRLLPVPVLVSGGGRAVAVAKELVQRLHDDDTLFQRDDGGRKLTFRKGFT